MHTKLVIIFMVLLYIFPMESYAGKIPTVKKSDKIVCQSDKKRKSKVANEHLDSDGDGVPDLEDECKDIPGLPATKGCPDIDGDGIADHLDKCPTVPGLKQFKGCPDSDGDGIPDNKDACPNEAGPLSNNGCPLIERGNDTFAKVVNLDAAGFTDADIQLHRYEKYLYEIELDKEYQISALLLSRKPVETKKKTPVIASVKDEKEPTSVKAEEVVVKSSAIIIGPNPEYIPELELILDDLEFKRGRINFLDQDKGFKALIYITRFCNIGLNNNYKKVTFLFHSNELNNQFLNNQLSNNRVEIIRKMLVMRLNVPPEKLDFVIVDNKEPKNNLYNYISLEIELP